MEETESQLPPRINEIAAKITPILKKYGVVSAAIFGSFARGEEKENSDLDILVAFKDGKTPGINYVHMWLELKEATGREVDLVSYNFIHPLLKKYILSEQIKIL
ncbi:MAG: nucleotidyltransferase family protein [Candidatus Parvarchaeota archaeon]|jgi:hypothetical protein|nr:nucleotidyltransferase family protein [Candidatus Parvarchaeota archaeon]